MDMKTLKILMAAGLALAATSSFADSTPGTGIKGTKHDWSGSAQSVLQWLDSKGVVTTYVTGTPNLDPVTGLQTKTTVSIGLCTKCHTPHQAKSTNLLWNHTLMSTEYEWNVPATTAGTAYPKFKGDTYKGASTKCLSCHDGLMASTDGMWFNRQKVTGSKYVAQPGTLDSGHEVAEGAEMSGSHPVAFPYPYNNAANAYNGTTTGDAATLAEFVADPSLNGVRLFNDDGAGNIIAGVSAGRTGMECTSCHDVHNGATTKDVMLLRGKLNGSDTAAGGYICTQCHKK
jgi:nitrate reductase cytochrome c-type subunit